MDLKNKLILFRKKNETEFKDVTSNVLSISTERSSYLVEFKNGKKYNASFNNVIIMNKQGDTNLLGYKVVVNNMLKKDVVKIEVYENIEEKRFKIYCKNGYAFIAKPEELELAKLSNKEKKLLKYWNDCACESNIDIIYDMMQNQYENIEYLPRSNVLYSYINQSNKKNEIENNIICPFSFNNSQLQAIYNALTNKISIIKGPPGTGKTQTILNIISNLIVHGKNVAIISANNAAIDNIEYKLKEKGYGGLIASLGSGERKDIFFECQNNSIKRNKEEKIEIDSKKLIFLSDLFKNENKAKLIKEEIRRLSCEKEYYEKFNYNDLINVDKYNFKTAKELIEYVVAYQEDIKEKDFTVFLWLKLIFKYGFKKSLLKVENRNQVITSLEYKYYQLRIKEISKELVNIENDLELNQLNKLKKDYSDISKQYLDKYIDENIEFDLKFTRKDYKKEFSVFIKRYPIVTSTAISLISSIGSDFSFDYVIIDESSQVKIPDAVPLLNRCRNIIVVGDDKQLAPVGEYSTEYRFESEEYDSNKESLITSFIRLFPNVITTLVEHYRCAPSIIGFCNTKYYNNELIPYTTETDAKGSLSVIYTAEGNHMRRIKNGEECGIYNQREIDNIEYLLVNTEINKSDVNNIGIISPYRLQADKLQEAFQKIECDTIHKFQGREKEIIIFSSVLDNKATKNDFLFVDDARMINVAVSRAINKFILVADNSVFNNKGKEIHDLINYISYKTINENLYQSKIISIFDMLYECKDKERERLLKNNLSKSRFDSEKLLRNLLDQIIFNNIEYKQFHIQEQVKMKDFIFILDDLTENEKKYMANFSSVDFLIKDKVSQDIICIIEVDGISFHENNKNQQEKDRMKTSILKKKGITLLRLKTNGSNEEEKIKQIFDEYLNKFT